MEIFIILLISLIIPLHEAYYLLVQFSFASSPNGKNPECLYNNQRFVNYKVMLNRIKKEFPYVPPCNLLLEQIGEYRSPQLAGYLSKASSDVYEPKIVLSPSETPIVAFTHQNKRYFSCSGSYYASYKTATVCVDDLFKYSKFKSQQSVLLKDPNSQKIWNSLWANCYFDCFRKDDFLQLRKRFFKELNQLRAIHNLPPFKFSTELETYARKRAKYSKGEIRDKTKKERPANWYEITGKISPPFASTQMNKWYGQYLKSKHVVNKVSIYLKSLRLLFAPTPREIGFGVSMNTKNLFIACEMR